MPTVEFTQLADLASAHEIHLADPQLHQLARYCELLWDWNERINLTRHTTLEKFVTRDLIDTMQLAELLATDETVLDVGSGGGVPGILLGIIRPDLKITLSESIGKKVRVLENLVEELDLPISVHQARAEHLLRDEHYFDVLVARAVGPLWKICRWFESHWLSMGRLLAVKGSQWADERYEARQRGFMKDIELRRAATYASPATGANHVILKLWSKKLPETGPSQED